MILNSCTGTVVERSRVNDDDDDSSDDDDDDDEAEAANGNAVLARGGGGRLSCDSNAPTSSIPLRALARLAAPAVQAPRQQA